MNNPTATAPPGCAPTTGSESDALRREVRRLIKLGRNMLSMIEEYHQCEWEEEPFTPDIEDMEAQLESTLLCQLCKGTEITDGAMGYNGDGPCPRCCPTGNSYAVRVEVFGHDRLSCSAHLRRMADLIMIGDAPGWTTSDVNGSASADRFTPNDKLSHGGDNEQ